MRSTETSTSARRELEFRVPVRDVEGKEVEQLVVDGLRLDQRVRPRLLKEAILMYQANRRVGTHETKTRGQVAGSNKKPWRQKGTGRARAGTRKSPLWRGGGIIFGPHPRRYGFSMSKAKRRLALRSALFAKFRDGEVVVVDGLKVDKPRTRYLAGVLRSLGIRGRCLIGLGGLDRNLVLSARNIPLVQVAPAADFNALDVLTASTILLTREGLSRLLSSTLPSPPQSPQGGTLPSPPPKEAASPRAKTSPPSPPRHGQEESPMVVLPEPARGRGAAAETAGETGGEKEEDR